MPDGGIHTTIVEEHHEAFYVWRHAHVEGWLSLNEPTALLHVDEHADMALPVLRQPIRSLVTLADCAKFTYRNLGINNFICPAVFQGWFDRVYWLRIQHAPTAGGWRRLRILADSPKELTFSKTASTRLDAPLSRGCAEYAPITTKDKLPHGLPCVLDIDLDYFCWNDYPELGELTLEITEDACFAFENDRYHFLKLSQSGRVSIIQRNGLPFLSFADPEPPRPVVTPAEIVLRRVEEFVSYVIRHAIAPRLIVLCRSRHSGYVQRAHVDWVQRTLLESLDARFGLKMHHIDDLLGGSFRASDIFDRQRPIREDQAKQYA